MKEARDNGSQIFVFGNGGSSATAAHLACDLVKGTSYQRDKRFRVIALTDNIQTITAYSNDVCYEDVFVEQLKNFVNKNDLVIALSGSGNSENVIKTIDYANKKGCRTIGLSGRDGGRLKVHIKRVFFRLGFVEKDSSVAKVVYKARSIHQKTSDMSHQKFIYIY